MENTPPPEPTPAAPADAKKPFLTWTRVNLVFPAIVVAVCIALRACETPGVNNAPMAFFLAVIAQFAALIMNIIVCRAYSKGLWPLQVILALGSSFIPWALIFVGCSVAVF